MVVAASLSLVAAWHQQQKQCGRKRSGSVAAEVAATAAWQKCGGGSVAVVAAAWQGQFGSSSYRHCCRATAACRCGGNEDTSRISNCGGTDNQQSTKSSGRNSDRNGDDDSKDDK